ncbi:translocation/assembly module TamB [Aquimarina sp. ERC-38]|uniref:translocation/assembly module TamB domain-containing protein n=1 Tax=Aquimarina sp. ERC-38 TaxID=2949996 RepID=UPI0022466A51|nr:translocation/assembly module TamB domain-containing protein [Aquimarina sp. ERC-38]UZO82468.1 translocation/assembly module TamB [Aquimarina sp. ERC-38]
MTDTKKKTRSKTAKWIRGFAIAMLSVLVFFIVLVLFIRSEWGQNLIVDKALAYITDKTNTKITVDKIYLTFGGNIFIDDLYVEDTQKDTLLYSHSLEASIGLIPLVQGEAFELEELLWNKAVINIKRPEGKEDYNFQFLIDAFVTPDTATIKEPDTTENALAIQIGLIDLEAIRATVNDAEMGLTARLNLGKFVAEAKSFDLDSMAFVLEETLLENTNLIYKQTKPFPVPEEETETLLPIIEVEDIEISNVQIIYDVPPDNLFADVDVTELLIEDPVLNLRDQIIKLEALAISNTNIAYKSITKPIAEPVENDTQETTKITWPEWEVALEDINISNSNITLIQSDSITAPNQFNPGNLSLLNLQISIPEVQLNKDEANLAIEQIAFTEKSGFQLQNVQLNASVTPSRLDLSKIVIATGNSSINGKVQARFKSLEQLANQPEATQLSLKIPEIKVGMADAYYFQPALAENQYITLIAKQPVNGQLFASGTLQEVQLTNTQVRWGAKTQLAVSGIFTNLTTPDSLQYNIDQLNLVSRKSDFDPFLKEISLPITIPDTLQLTGDARGTLTSLQTTMQLTSSEGDVGVNGTFDFGDAIAVDSRIDVENLQLNNLLQNPQLGKLSITAEAKASGATVNELNAIFTSRVEEVDFNGYTFKDFNLNGNIENGNGTISGTYKDDYLNMKLDSQVVLDSISPEATATIEVIGADLNALGLTQKIIKTQFTTNAGFKGSADGFDANVTIDNITVVHNQDSYSVDPIKAKAFVTADTTDVWLNSRFLKTNLASNADIATTTGAITRQVKQYISNQKIKDTIPGTVQVAFELGFKETPVLSDVFLKGLKNSDTVLVKASFDENKEHLKLQASAPSLSYLDGTLDSLKLDVNGNQQELDFTLDWAGITYDPVNIQETTIKGEVRDQILYVAFDSFDKDEAVTSVKSELKLRNDTLYYHLNPNSLVLEKSPWQIQAGNEIRYTDNHIYVKDFTISKENKSFTIASGKNSTKETLEFLFKNLELGGLTKFLNPEQRLASGTLNGEVIIEDLFNKTGLVADITIDQLAVTEVPLGTFSLDANSKQFNNYDLDVSLKGSQIDMTTTGNYKASTGNTTIDLNFNLNKLDMKLVEQLAEDAITEASGSISAQARFTGPLLEPNYKGSFNFNKTSITAAILGTPLSLSQEKVTFDNTGIFLEQFTITDVDNNPLDINGNIGTKTFANPTFDLSVKTKDFTAIDANEEDSNLFYGKVNFSSDIKVTGDLEIPKVRGSLSISENSNFTLIIPETEVSIKEREGVVLFVNKENPDAILTRTEDINSQAAQIQGFDIEAKLNIGDQSLFKIIIDQRTEDYFQVHGNGDFQFGMKPSGQMNLAGRYDITDGQYKVSLYNLVKREFDIASGGSIVWSGDPFEAQLNVRAIYEVEANAAGIMRSAVDAQQFNRDLDFLVYLNVNGELLQPEISFNLDLPEGERGFGGGALYGKVQQLNEQEAELNKQVFSLLVFNRFFPESGSDGSSGGPASIARDNVNRVLSGQLNSFSEKLLGDSGIALDFQLDSYNTYQNNSATANTDLAINAKKKLFDDRLIVQVGSSVNVEGNRQAGQQSSPIIGNVALEYLLTEDGKYRLKGFRKNEFESVIDGQLIVTGIAFIFNREFNRFWELWKSLGIVKEDEEGN